MKICDQNKQTNSKVLELPKDISEISAFDFLKFGFSKEGKKKVCFIASGLFFCLIDIVQDKNYEFNMNLSGLYKNEKAAITCLASCPINTNESYSVVCGDELGKIRIWNLSIKNELLKEYQFNEMDTETSITSLAFSHAFEYLSCGNSISEYKIWEFSSGKEIKNSKDDSSQENVFLQYGHRNNNLLFVAYEGGTVFSEDLNGDRTELLNKEHIFQKKNRQSRVDFFVVNNIFLSFRKNFLIIWTAKTLENGQSSHHFLFFSENRKLIEENLAVKEEVTGFATSNNTFAYSTSKSIHIYQLQEDFEVLIEPPKMFSIKSLSFLNDNNFWVGGTENTICYGVNSKIKNKATFFSIEQEEEKNNQNEKPLSCLTYCLEKNLLACCFGNLLKIWKVSYQNQEPEYEIYETLILPSEKVKCLCFDSKGEILVFSDKKKVSYILFEKIKNPEFVEFNGKPQKNIRSTIYCNSKNAIIFSGIYLDNFLITFWYHHPENHYQYFVGHQSKIQSLIISNDEQYLISGGFDGKIIVWNLNQIYSEEIVDNYEKELKLPNQKISSLAFSNSMKTIASVSFDIKHNFSLIFWSFDTGQKENVVEMKERVKNVRFCSKDKYVILTQKNTIKFKNIRNYFYKSSFDILHTLLKEKLDVEEYVEKYPQIFNKKFMTDMFLFFEEKKYNQTILHTYGFLAKSRQENFYEKCLQICDYFEIIPKFSLDKNSVSPLDLVSKDTLYRSIQILLKGKFPLNFCPAIKIPLIKRLAKYDPLLLTKVLENRFCDPYGVLQDKLPVFEGPISQTIDRLVLSNEFIAKNIIPTKTSFFKVPENKDSKNAFDIKILDIPYITDPDNGFIKSKKKAMIESTHPFYGAREFEGILDFKWNKYAKIKFFRRGIIFLIYVIILSINSIFILPHRLYPDDEEDFKARVPLGIGEKFHVLSILFDISLLLFAVFFLFSEFVEMCKRKKEYFKDLWNYFDLFNMGFLTLSIILDFISIFDTLSDYHLLKGFFAMTMLLAWLRLVTYSRGFKGLGFMVRLLIQVFVDMINFLILMFFITLSITVAGFLLQDYNKFSIFQTFNSFYRLILGDFGGFDDLSDNGVDWLLWIFFFIGTLSLQIIMLNLLIAIISDTYQKVTENNILANNYEKAQIVAEMDELMNINEKNLLRNTCLKKYLCVLYSKEIKVEVENEEKEENRELLKRVQKIEDKIEEIKAILLRK